MTDTKVVVIEQDAVRAASWAAVLRFLDYEPIVVNAVSDLDWPAPDQLDWVAVMVGEGNSTGAMRELLARLRDYDGCMPILSANGGLGHDSDEHSAQLELELPVRYPQLSAALREAGQIRDASPQAPAQRFRPGGNSPAITQVNALIERVAGFDTSVMVLGESGTGKEMVARRIHELSARAQRPFVPVNCGAIPQELLESELFGHEKGAFTGALTARVGRFEYAEGGTLFLDEIGDMPASMQVKLLRVLQERSFERVGGNRTVHCNVRIIAATHRDVEAEISAGRFREDLFYRLNVFPIQLPALRERREDLPVLVRQLLSRVHQQTGQRLDLGADAMQALMAHDWPGNVRELGNLLERLAILHPGKQISAEVLPERYRNEGDAVPATGEVQSEQGLGLRDHLAQVEQTLIREALARSGGTVAEAARLLQVQRTTLVEKLRKYGIEGRAA